MKTGDIVQLKICDGNPHWVFAVVQDPATNRVQIRHPQYREDAAVILAGDGELRTKADVEALIEAVKPILSRGHLGLTETLIRELAALDGFWRHFIPPDDGRLTDHQSRNLNASQIHLHKLVVNHYQRISEKLS